jgi:hypothetical protein
MGKKGGFFFDTKKPALEREREKKRRRKRQDLQVFLP